MHADDEPEMGNVTAAGSNPNRPLRPRKVQ
jgi:hypothetical protein